MGSSGTMTSEGGRPKGASTLSQLSAWGLETALSFELLFLLFLVSGEFKTLPIFQPINRLLPGERGDLTALLLAVNLLGAAYILIKRGLVGRPVIRWTTKRLGYVAAVLLFIAHVLFSYAIAPDNPRADSKLMEFSTVIIWCFFVGLVVSDRPERVRRFVMAYCMVTLLIATVGIARFATGGIDVRTLTGGFGSGYHRLGRMSGGTVVVCALLWLLYRQRSVRTALALAAVVALGGLLVSGQRAPYFALSLTVAVLVGGYALRGRLLQGEVSGWKIVAGTFVVGAIVALLLTQTERGNYVLYRLSRIGFSPEENDRVLMWMESLKTYADNPFLGVGFGNFSVATGLERWRHPHNLLIEMLLETGIVGFFFTGVVFFAWMAFIRPNHGRAPLLVVLKALFWYTFFNALVSGDITDNRIFVALAVMLTSVVTWREQESPGVPRSASSGGSGQSPFARSRLAR